MTSICIFHNGNSRILKEYREKFSNKKFKGNWADATDKHSQDCLWEICFADATRENLKSAIDHSVFIIRHISDYQDDINHRLDECKPYDYDFWVNFIVSQHLSFSNLVVSDVKIAAPIDEITAIITTGRTANTHLQQVLKKQNINSFEYSKIIDSYLLKSKSAIFLWRCDQWECLTSTWIAMKTKYKKSHQTTDIPELIFDSPVPDISHEWIDNQWYNMCCNVLDHAMFYHYICQKPVYCTTTEYVVNNFQSTQIKINYDKSNLIGNYLITEEYYKNSAIANTLNFLYNNVINHIDNKW